MAVASKPSFTPRKHGEPVHWPYRSGIGDGTIESVDQLGESEDTTRYNVRELDHHTGEAAIVKHYGRVLKSGWDHHRRSSAGGIVDTSEKAA